MNDDSSPSRDFIGYADQPPAVVWPDEARIAVNFCINYEEGGELCVLNGDDRSEVRVADVAVQARIGGRDLNIESSYEYGSRVGYWRLLEALPIAIYWPPSTWSGWPAGKTRRPCGR